MVAQEFVSRRSTGDAEERRARNRRETAAKIAAGARYLLALYPGEHVELPLRIHGPRGHAVAVRKQGFPRHVASLEISPQQARAPYQARIAVSVHPHASPGVYPWKLEVVDVDAGRPLGEEHIVLVVLPRTLPRNAAKVAPQLQKLYLKRGVQVALWAALRTLYPHGAPFSTVKALYQLLTGRRVSKGTVGNTLRAMLRKGLLERRGGLYRAPDLDLETVLSRVDLKRVRYPWQVLEPRRGQKRGDGSDTSERYRFTLGELPQPIQKAYMHAKRIATRHGALAGLYFLLHSLMGVRQTGYLLLWYNGWFIVLEPKTGFAHHFYSWLLHWMLQSLGLMEGVYYRPNDKRHLEAQRIAQKYIREIYGSHQAARRLHYMLWERGYVWSGEDEVYTVKIHHYPNGEVGLQVLDKSGKEELYSEDLREEPPLTVETYTALPVRHLDPRREETYHHRPAGIY